MSEEYKFIDECSEWLRPFGYTLHSHSGDKKTAVYTHVEAFKNQEPSITCRDGETERSVEITYMVPSSFFYFSSGKMMFKHPRFEFFLEKMKDIIKKIEK